MVQVRLRTLSLEDVLKMIRPEGPAIFPLRITGSVAFAYGDPSMLAHGLARLRVGLLKPGNNQRSLRLKLSVRHVVIRQGKVKRILPRSKRNGDVIAARRSFRGIKAAVARLPVGVPATLVVRNWI